jgi:hypothetical protein
MNFTCSAGSASVTVGAIAREDGVTSTCALTTVGTRIASTGIGDDCVRHIIHQQIII